MRSAFESRPLTQHYQDERQPKRRSRLRPVVSSRPFASIKDDTAFEAVGRVVSMICIGRLIVRIGWDGNHSKRRAAANKLPCTASTRLRSSLTNAESSRALRTASAAIVATLSRKNRIHPSQSPAACKLEVRTTGITRRPRILVSIGHPCFERLVRNVSSKSKPLGVSLRGLVVDRGGNGRGTDLEGRAGLGRGRG